MKFEESMRALSEITAKLEAGGLTLEDSVALYAEGAKLAAACKEELDAAELKVSGLEQPDPAES